MPRPTKGKTDEYWFQRKNRQLDIRRYRKRIRSLDEEFQDLKRNRENTLAKWNRVNHSGKIPYDGVDYQATLTYYDDRLRDLAKERKRLVRTLLVLQSM